VAERVLQAARHPTARTETEQVERGSIHNLLSLANVDQSVQGRVLRLQDAMWRIAPGAVTSEDLPWLLLIPRCPWVGSPETLRPPARSVRRKREAMALHLLTAYPVPPFLVRALDVEPLAVARVPEEDEWAVRILSHVGRGDSLRKLVGSRWLPSPLTRAMQHRFLSARADTPPILALRTAQVVGLGGPAAFARRLCRTRLQALRGPDPDVGEGLWHRSGRVLRPSAGREVEGASAMVAGLESAPSVTLQVSALNVLDGEGATVGLSTVILNRFTLEYAAEGITGCVAEPNVEGRADPVIAILDDTEAWVSGTFEGPMRCNEGDLDVQGEFDAEKTFVIETGS